MRRIIEALKSNSPEIRRADQERAEILREYQEAALNLERALGEKENEEKEDTAWYR